MCVHVCVFVSACVCVCMNASHNLYPVVNRKKLDRLKYTIITVSIINDLAFALKKQYMCVCMCVCVFVCVFVCVCLFVCVCVLTPVVAILKKLSRFLEHA